MDSTDITTRCIETIICCRWQYEAK